MTEPQDDHSSTRPISVAELLARNGTIGAPPVGGRRRRRRGNADSVTVAELTGEIPILTDAVEAPAAAHDVADDVAEVVEVAELDVDEVPDEPEEEAPVASAASNGVVAHAPVQAPSEAEAEYAAHLEQRDADPEPIDFAPPPRRAHIAPRTGFSAPTGGAEQMSPDPVVDDDDDDDDDDLALLDIDDVDDVPPAPYEVETEDAPSYRRSSADTLFGGGQSVADDLARRGRQPGPEDIDLGDEDVKPADVAPREVAEERGSSFLRGVWVVAQCILAVAFGAGLFIAFDQLWKWNSIVALVLGVLVILGLVVGVRVVRKTEDIGSTLIAVAVGAMVTFGPLALLQAH
jgi:hypothetical protein